MSSLYIYLSRYPEALEIKIEAFLAEIGKEEKVKNNLLHLKRVDFQTVQNSLTQIDLFSEYTHYIFEEYLGDFQELARLFENITISSKILITKTVDARTSLPWNLAQKLGNREYSLFFPSFRLKEQYFFNLQERLQLKLSREWKENIKKEAFSSIFLIKGVLIQLKTMLEGEQKLGIDELRKLIKANEISQRAEEKYYFLTWYLSQRIQLWTLFLRELNEKPKNAVIEFLRYFSFTLNSYFWKDGLSSDTVKFIHELSYNYFLFLERELFKIKSGSDWVLLYFFWKNQPKAVLKLNS